MSQRCALGWGGVSVAALVLGACLTVRAEQQTPRAEAAKLKNPVASNAASLAAGQQLYQKYCRFCHGTTGHGDSPTAPKDIKPSNLTDEVWDRGSSDGEIFVVIQEGAGPDYRMKGLKGKITDQDTWNLVNYVRSLAAPAK